jgi:hypothetical protein
MLRIHWVYHETFKQRIFQISPLDGDNHNICDKVEHIKKLFHNSIMNYNLLFLYYIDLITLTQ